MANYPEDTYFDEDSGMFIGTDSGDMYYDDDGNDPFDPDD